MSFKNLRNLKQVTLFISIFLLISQNSCKIQDAPGNSNITDFVDIAKLRPEMKVEQSEVFNWIAANIPDEHKSSLQLNHIQQRFIDNHHVIKIPINDGAALFFTKDSAKLKAFAYKWDDRDPGTKRYTGHIISYSFQDFSVRALKYYEGKKISDGTLINNSSSFFPGKGPVSTTLKNTAATQGLLATSGENKLRTMSILSDIWCVLTGGTVYAIVGDTGNGCDYSNGWITSLMGFLAQVFEGSGNSNPASYGSDPAAAAGIWYGPSAYTGPSPTQGGGAGNGNTPATQPYTGGPVWVSQWVDTTNPDNCMAMDEFGNMTWVPGGCSTGYWQSVQIGGDGEVITGDYNSVYGFGGATGASDNGRLSCQSFIFKKLSPTANSQEAGVSGLSFVVDLEDGTPIRIYKFRTMYFSVGVQQANGNVITPGKAAEMAAAAANKAGAQLSLYYRGNPIAATLFTAVVENDFKARAVAALQQEVAGYGAILFTPTGTNTSVKPAVWNGPFMQIFNGITGGGCAN